MRGWSGFVNFLSTEAFLMWAAARGIGRNPRYPKSGELTFTSESGTWYRYRRPEPPEPLSESAGRAVRVAAAGSSLWLFPPWRNGMWFPPAYEGSGPEHALYSELREAGIPPAYRGAVSCDPSELSIATRLFLAAVEEGRTNWQLGVIPAHAQCVLRVDDDGDLMGSFPSESACNSFTEALRKAGWREPIGPDPTVSETDPWLELGR